MAKCNVKDVLKIANSQVGYLEKKNNKDLDSDTANAGSNNYTKYARDFKEFTGKNFQAQSWCDMFVDWCFVQAYGEEKAKELLGGFDAYTPNSASYFKKMDRWKESNPSIGDVVFFKNSQRINHTGIVINVDKYNIYTIEGNTSGGSGVIENGGGVFSKKYTLTNSRIAGYGSPKYDTTDTVTAEKPQSQSAKYHYEYYIVKKGDHLSKIANEYGVSVDDIVKLNSIKDKNSINVGQKLLITTYLLYTVIKGDTLSKISRELLKNANRYKEIMILNGMKKTTLNIGQVLKIPN